MPRLRRLCLGLRERLPKDHSCSLQPLRRVRTPAASFVYLPTHALIVILLLLKSEVHVGTSTGTAEI